MTIPWAEVCSLIASMQNALVQSRHGGTQLYSCSQEVKAGGPGVHGKPGLCEALSENGGRVGYTFNLRSLKCHWGRGRGSSSLEFQDILVYIESSRTSRDTTEILFYLFI